jgi:hypothetical protein
MEARTEPTPRDLELPQACVLCGGALAVRVGPAGAWSCCRRCRWISRVHLAEEDGRVALAHPPGGVA